MLRSFEVLHISLQKSVLCDVPFDLEIKTINPSLSKMTGSQSSAKCSDLIVLPRSKQTGKMPLRKKNVDFNNGF